jgi:hypothetical protein
MADIFLSYKREDQEIAREVAADLEAEDFSVFFDLHIEVGDSWDSTIERELNAASAVVVLWSPNSRESKWVRREARAALDRAVLCPAAVVKCTIPLEFSDVQTADLTGRRFGDREHNEWRRLCDAVGRCLGRRPEHGLLPSAPHATSRTPSVPHATSRAPDPKPLKFTNRTRRAMLVAGASVGAAILIGGYGWNRLEAEKEMAAQIAIRAIPQPGELPFSALMLDDPILCFALEYHWRSARQAATPLPPTRVWQERQTRSMVEIAEPMQEDLGWRVLVVTSRDNLTSIARDFRVFRTVEHLTAGTRELDISVGEGFSPTPDSTTVR